MDKNYFLNLARRGTRMPIGADLVLREAPDAEEILREGPRLGQVLAAAAARYGTPLAMPVMDLVLEKAFLLRGLGIPEADIAAWHFTTEPTAAELQCMREGMAGPLDERLTANVEAVRYVATHTGLIPVGMSIGPFSLMSKLVKDPITPVFLGGMGISGDDDPEVQLVETALELAVEMILRSLEAQVAAGAKVFFMAEPAANKVYLSPNQLAEGSDVLERFVLRHNRRIRERLEQHGVNLFFHCCGELTDEILQGFCSLKPAVLSLGSSRHLWEDAARVPKDIVLYGNLPSKRFYSDDLISVAELQRQAVDLEQRMQQAGHPFILGTECDVLSVPGCEVTIARKVALLTGHGCSANGIVPCGHQPVPVPDACAA